MFVEPSQDESISCILGQIKMITYHRTRYLRRMSERIGRMIKQKQKQKPP
jgi:hypothetical protein